MSLESLLIFIEATDRASKPIQKVADSIEQLQKSGKTISDVGSKISDFGEGMTRNVTAPIVAGLGLAAHTAIAFESSMAEVQKAANLDASGMETMQGTILEMSRTIPRSANELAEMAAAGGRLGIAANDLDDFVSLTSEMSVAFDMASDQAGQAAAEIANNFGMMNAATGEMDFARLETFGNTVNNLADNMATTEANIVNFTNRASGVGKTFGIMENDVAAFGAAFTALGIAPEKASNAFNTTAQRLAMATELGGKAAEGFDQLGLSATDMQQAFAKGRGTEAMMNFLVAVQDGGPAAGSALSKILGQGFSDEILQAAGGMEQFEKAFDKANEAVAGGGSTMQDSFDSISGTTASQMQFARNALSEIGVTLGTALLPVINDVLAAIIPMAHGFAEFVSNHPGVTQIGLAIAGIAAAAGPALIVIGQIVAAVGKLKMAFAGIKTAMLFLSSGGGIGAIFASIKTAIAGVVQSAAGLGLILAGVAVAVFNIGARFAGVRMSVTETIAVIGQMIAQIPANLAAIPAFVSSVISMVVAIVRNRVGQIRVAVAQGVQQSIAAIRAGVPAAIAAVGAAGQAIIGRIRAIAGQAFSAGAQIIQRLAAGIRSAIGSVTSAIGSVASAIAAAMPGSPVKTGPLTVLNSIGSNPGAEIVNMLARGIQSAAPSIGQALGQAGQQGLGGFTGPLPPRAASGGGGGIVINAPLTVNASDGGSQELTAILDEHRDRIIAAVEEYFRNKERVSYSS